MGKCHQSDYRRHVNNPITTFGSLPSATNPPPSIGFGFGLPHLSVPQCLCRRATILLPKVVLPVRLKRLLISLSLTLVPAHRDERCPD